MTSNDFLDFPGKVTIVDDLEEGVESGQDNYVEVNVTYDVPEEEREYWEKLVNDLLNNNDNE